MGTQTETQTETQLTRAAPRAARRAGVSAGHQWRKRRDSNPRSLAGRSLSRRVHSAALPRFHAAGYADDSVPVERVRSCYARPARSVVDSWCTSESSARGTRPRHTR